MTGVVEPKDFSGDELPLLLDACWHVVTAQFAAHSWLQRRLRCDYAQSGRLLALLEAWGVVGPKNGTFAREVLVRVEGLEAVHKQMLTWRRSRQGRPT